MAIGMVVFGTIMRMTDKLPSTLHQPLHSKVANYLNDQRRTGRFCDLKIELETETASAWAHFCVVGAQSEFIGGQHFLQNSFEISIHNPLKVKILNFTCGQCLQTIVDFFYEDVISISKEHEIHFKELARILSVTELLRLFSIKNTDINENNFITPKNDIYAIIENVFDEKRNYFKVRNPKIVPNCKINYCIGCDFKCYKIEDMVIHMSSCEHSNLSCSMCEVGFLTNGDFNEHLQKHNNKKKPFFCIECDARFMTRAALLIHHPKHSTEAPFICPHCSKGFKWKQGLSSHLLIHNKEKKMLCDVCGYSTTHMKALKSHKLTHTGELFKCTYPGCNHTTNRKENLKIHIDTHKQEQPFVCEICGYKFSQSKNLKRHALKHSTAETERHKCQLCVFTSHRSDKLKEHMRRVHTEKAMQLELPEIVENAFEMKNIFEVCPDMNGTMNQALKKKDKRKSPIKRKRKQSDLIPGTQKPLRKIAPKLSKRKDEQQK